MSEIMLLYYKNILIKFRNTQFGMVNMLLNSVTKIALPVHLKLCEKKESLFSGHNSWFEDGNLHLST